MVQARIFLWWPIPGQGCYYYYYFHKMDSAQHICKHKGEYRMQTKQGWNCRTSSIISNFLIHFFTFYSLLLNTARCILNFLIYIESLFFINFVILSSWCQPSSNDHWMQCTLARYDNLPQLCFFFTEKRKFCFDNLMFITWKSMTLNIQHVYRCI